MARFRQLLVAIAIAGAIVPISDAHGQALPDSSRLAIHRVFANVSASDGPGCAVGIARRGEVIYENGYGAANLETNTPITPQSIFHVASVSKQFTAAAIVLLVRDGKLSLDDQVRKHIPELHDHGVPITIRQLLHHTSGLRDQWSLLAMARGRFEENRITDADVLEIVSRQRELNFPPGTQYEYSNTGYTLAALIVKRVSGQSLREFAHARIFKPLGMTQTHFHDDYTMLVRGRTSAYTRGPDGVLHVSIPNFDTYGATSLYTTTGDLLKWGDNLQRPIVGDSSMYALMLASGVLTTGERTGYGLGMTSGQYREQAVIGHGGADAGYRAQLDVVPAQGLTIAVLCNASYAAPNGLSRAIIDVLLRPQLAAVPAPLKASYMPAPPALDRAAGLWIDRNVGRPLTLARRDSILVIGEGPRALVLVAIDDSTYRTPTRTADYVLRSDGALELRNLSGTAPPLVFSRYPRVSLAGPALKAFEGTYHSEELGATYQVVAGDSTLVLKTRWGNDWTIRALATDRFDGDALVLFTRGRNGAIDGFRVSSSRARHVKFVRIAPGRQ